MHSHILNTIFEVELIVILDALAINQHAAVVMDKLCALLINTHYQWHILFKNLECCQIQTF